MRQHGVSRDLVRYCGSRCRRDALERVVSGSASIEPLGRTLPFKRVVHAGHCEYRALLYDAGPRCKSRNRTFVGCCVLRDCPSGTGVRLAPVSQRTGWMASWRWCSWFRLSCRIFCTIDHPSKIVSGDDHVRERGISEVLLVPLAIVATSDDACRRERRSRCNQILPVACASVDPQTAAPLSCSPFWHFLK